MKNISFCGLFFGLGFLLLFTPARSPAQDTGTPSVYCPNLTVTLQFDSRDSQTVPRGQVTELQKFLVDYYDLNSDDYVTGYFGRKTRDNVRKFQCEKQIACDGDEEVGYGVVGPRTRNAISIACGGGGTRSDSDPDRAPRVSITVNGRESIELPPTSVYTIAWNSSRALSCFLESMYGSGATSSNPVAPNAHGTSLAATIGGFSAHSLLCRNTYGGAIKTVTVQNVANLNSSCTLDGITIPHEMMWKFYSSSTVQAPATCESASQVRKCENGALSGPLIFNKSSCVQRNPPIPVVSLKADGRDYLSVASSSNFTITAHSANVATCTGAKKKDDEASVAWNAPVNASISFREIMSGKKLVYTMDCSLSSTISISRQVTVEALPPI